MKYFLIGMLSLIILACQKPTGYEKIEDGIIVQTTRGDSAQHIKLEVMSEDIIHVTVTPDSFSTVKSLVVLDEKRPKTDWKVMDGENQVSISTSSVKATIDRISGEITFSDTTGNILLAEKKGGGKKFTPVNVEHKPFYSVQQEFESPDDEAFYGLGQHQHGLMNYKGKNVELAQHNLVVAVPFLYSNKNYGILWDNASITRFGDPREYQPISSLKLFSKDDKPGGISATYFLEDKETKTEIVNKIDIEYLETPGFDGFPKEIANKGKVIWEGSFTSDVSGEHQFLLYASGLFKLWIDGKLVMDKWRQNWNPWSNQFSVNIQKDEKHTIKIEWICQGGYFALKHLDPQGVEQQNRLSLFSEVARQIDYYFIKGNSADEVIRGYRTITGKAPIAPNWAMGFWQSRERYKTQTELLDVVKEFRKRNVPLDNIVLDWFYWPEDKWGSHKFDSSRFADPKGMVDELHNNLHAQIMISVWPKFYPGTDNFNEMKAKGFLYTRNIEKNIDKKRNDWVGPGYTNTFYDAFNPEAGKLYWKQIDKNLNVLGFDGWWLDATEPDMHSNLSVEERKLNMSPTALGPGAQYFNAYSLPHAKAVYEGQRASSPDKRVFILTRSAFAGQQRYGAATWSGDIATRWSDMKDQISGGVNFSLSGLPYWTMDIGGFAVDYKFYDPKNQDEWKELNTRWYQFGAFCPLFRVHGQFPFREIFNVSKQGEVPYQSMLYYDKLRYRLMPYIYSLAGKAYHNDYTIMRGLVMDFGADKNVLNINDQFMFGPSLLINPVYEYKARTRQVYMPSGTGWYDLYSGKFYEGGQSITVQAPLATIPVFVKQGAILATGPEIQYVNEKPADPVTVYVFTGKDGSFELYEDEGVNYNYEKGEFSTIPILYEDQSGTLTIGERKGSFKGMLTQRTINVIWVKPETPIGIDSKAPTSQSVKYDGKSVRVTISK